VASSTREVFLLLKARDEASRVLRGFSAQIARSANEVNAAALRAQAIATQTEVVERRRRSAAMSAMVAERQLQAIEQDRLATQRRQQGYSQQAINAIRQRAIALRREAQEIAVNQRAYDKHTATLVAHIRQWDREASEMERAERQARSLSHAMGSAGQGLATFGAGMVAVGALSADFFYDSFVGWMEYDKAVRLTHTQIDGFMATLDQVSEIGLQIANDIPVAFAEIQPALFDIFSSTDATLRESEILLQGFSKAAVAGQTEIQVAARGTMAIMNAYNIPLDRVNEVLDVQFELVRKGVGTYAEFAKVFGRVVPAATRSQQSFETVAAMLAYMTRNGQSAAQASTAAARALELFTHPRAINNLQKMGVKVKDVKGNFRPLVDVLSDLRKELLKMPQADRVATIVDVFKGSGFNIQARRFLEQVVLGPGELEDFKKMLASMGDASGVMEDKYAQMADTAAGKTQLLANKWEVLRIKVGEAAAPAIIKIIDLMSGLLDKFNKLDPETKQMIVNIGLLTTAFIILGGILAVVAGAFVMIAGAVAIITPEMLLIAGAVLGIIAAFTALVVWLKNVYKDSEVLQGLWKDMKEDFTKIKDMFLELGRKIKEAWDTHMKPALDSLWKTIEEKVLPRFREFRREVWDVMYPKIREAFRIIGDIASITFQAIAWIIENIVIPAIDWLSTYWDENKEELMPLIEALAQVAKWMLIVAAVVVGVLVVGLVVSLFVAIVIVVGAFLLIVETIKLVKKSVLAVKAAFDDLISVITTVGTTISVWFEELKTKSKTWGENIIKGLITGITNQLGPLGSIMNIVAGVISDRVPHSPAKKGPLSGSGSPLYSGMAIGAMLAAGIRTSTPLVTSAVDNMVGMASPSAMMSMAPVGGYRANEAASTNASTQRGPVNVTIHTNEIDPRTTAADLGWEIDGRL
jgi:TP901 family phage tail tape measure protein